MTHQTRNGQITVIDSYFPLSCPRSFAAPEPDFAIIHYKMIIQPESSGYLQIWGVYPPPEDNQDHCSAWFQNYRMYYREFHDVGWVDYHAYHTRSRLLPWFAGYGPAVCLCLPPSRELQIYYADWMCFLIQNLSVRIRPEKSCFLYRLCPWPVVPALRRDLQDSRISMALHKISGIRLKTDQVFSSLLRVFGQYRINFACSAGWDR